MDCASSCTSRTRLLCFSMWQRSCTQETFATRSRRGGDEQCSLSSLGSRMRQSNFTVCPLRRRQVTCEVDARVFHEQKCRQTRFETTKPLRNIFRILNGGVEDTEELVWCWKRRVRAAERSFVHLGRFQANLESEVPVASLMLLSCMTSHLFHSRFIDAEQYSLRPTPTLTSWWPIGCLP